MLILNLLNPQEPSKTSNDVSAPIPSTDDPSVTNADSQFLMYLVQCLKSNVRVIRRIPKAARFYAAQEFAKCLESCVNNNSFKFWYKLPYASLNVAFSSPDHKDKATSKLSLATIVKRNLDLWMEIRKLPFDAFFDRIIPKSSAKRIVKKGIDSDVLRIKKVQTKLNDWDVRGAIRILYSNDSVSQVNLKLTQSFWTRSHHMI